ncbi:unnamed protein product, partial [Linum tenue]
SSCENSKVKRAQCGVQQGWVTLWEVTLNCTPSRKPCGCRGPKRTVSCREKVRDVTSGIRASPRPS